MHKKIKIYFKKYFWGDKLMISMIIPSIIITGCMWVLVSDFIEIELRVFKKQDK